MPEKFAGNPLYLVIKTQIDASMNRNKRSNKKSEFSLMNLAMLSVGGIPSKGLKVLNFGEEKRSFSPFIITERGIQTPYYKINIDVGDFFTSLYDKRYNREVLQFKKKGNLFIVYEDKPREFDNWNIDIYYDRKSWIVDDITKLE